MGINQKVWTEEDFDKMNWHDCKVYGIGFDDDKYKLVFDIDYILDWVKPEKDNIYYKFRVSPATLVFENVYDLNIELSTSLGWEICKIVREEPKVPRNKDYIKKDCEWKWRISSNQGDLSFNSVGFKQYIRRRPILTNGQSIDLNDRGGFSFQESYYLDIN